MLANKLFNELALGQEASITRVVTPDDCLAFAHASGNLNPANLPGDSGLKSHSPLRRLCGWDRFFPLY